MRVQDRKKATRKDLENLAKDGNLTGFFEVEDEDYHAGPGVSASDIANVIRSPAHYRAAKKSPKQTPAMRLGTMCHEFLLQPERFGRRYIIEPPDLIAGPKNKNPWKAHWEALKARAELEQKELLERSVFRDIEGLAQAVCDHPAGAALLDGSERELAAYVQDPDTFFVRKAKADILTPTGIIADLKTTDDARQDAFIRTIRAFHYHVKAAWYLDVFNAVAGPGAFDSFVWVAAEKGEPYGVACYAASEAMLDAGRNTYQKALDILTSCLEKNAWPCYAGEIQPIELPDFFYRSTENAVY